MKDMNNKKEINNKKVIKRDGRVVDFDVDKIVVAICKAMTSVGLPKEHCEEEAKRIANNVEKKCEKTTKIERIQDLVVDELLAADYIEIGVSYSKYRENRRVKRELGADIIDGVIGLLNGTNEAELKENANKNKRNVTTHRDSIAGIVNRKLSKMVLPEDIIKAHNEGAIHVHDLDYYNSPITNCGLINLQDIIKNGTKINGIMIEPPKSLRTGATLATQVIACTASSQYGGVTISIAHLAPLVKVSKEKLEKRYRSYGLEGETLSKIVDNELQIEIRDSIQTINYQLNTFHLVTGQAPFCTVELYIDRVKGYEQETALLIEEVFRQRIEGFKNKFGVNSTPVFPKLIYIMSDNNTYPGSKYYYLTEMASKCIARRANPDMVSAKKSIELIGDVICPMGCRSFLGRWLDEDGNPKYFGRLNVGVQTVNLPYIALLSKEQNRNFFEVLDEYLALIKKMGDLRFEKLRGVKAKVAPILWCDGVYLRLDPEEEILPHLENGYATVSLGYSGINDAVEILSGEDITTKIGHELGKEIMKHMKDRADEWKKESGRGWSCYSCPQENTTDKFTEAIKRRFGEDNIVVKQGYVTNSFHVNPNKEINAFDKLSCEADISQYSTGGNVSYVEVGNLEKNTEAIIQLMQFIGETNLYGEINTVSSYCNCCGGHEVKLNDGLKWQCANCGNDNPEQLEVTLRICGYLSNQVTYGASKARLNDIKSRVHHL